MKCFVCDKFVDYIWHDDIHYWERGKYPASRYWNVERKEVYCGPECSLERHERLKSGNGINDVPHPAAPGVQKYGAEI